VGTPQGALVREKGMSMRTRLEEDALIKVAQITLGEYRRVGQASELKRVYDDLGQKMKFEKRGVSEVTHLMGLIGMLLALLAAIVRLKRRGHLG
jgi:Ca-activated chloride channel family protein